MTDPGNEELAAVVADAKEAVSKKKSKIKINMMLAPPTIVNPILTTRKKEKDLSPPLNTPNDTGSSPLARSVSRSGSRSRTTSRSISGSRSGSRSRGESRSRSRSGTISPSSRSSSSSRRRSVSTDSNRSSKSHRSHHRHHSPTPHQNDDVEEQGSTLPQDIEIDLCGTAFHIKTPIHAVFCHSCDLPIAVHAKLKPCSHVFCFTCATNHYKKNECSFCKNPVDEVEKLHGDEQQIGALVHVCKYSQCRRSFSEHRTLQRHEREHHHQSSRAGHHHHQSLVSSPDHRHHTHSSSSSKNRKHHQTGGDVRDLRDVSYGGRDVRDIRDVRDVRGVTESRSGMRDMRGRYGQQQGPSQGERMSRRIGGRSHHQGGHHRHHHQGGHHHQQGGGMRGRNFRRGFQYRGRGVRDYQRRH